jgi:7,8-dihydroneopterin aldolase/epimerase/oxygenase
MVFGGEQGRDGVGIEGIRFDCRIGVTVAERSMLQRVLVSLFFEHDLAAAGKTDVLRKTVDYRAVTAVVVDVGSKARVKLLEALGYRIGTHILQRFPSIQMVRVMVRKPGTPGNVEAVATFATFRRSGKQ